MHIVFVDILPKKLKGGFKTRLLDEFVGNPQLLSPSTLAFLGDGVYELMVRERLLNAGSMPAGKLHALSVKKVKAAAQSAAWNELLDVCTEAEADILRRGRNANVKPPKSCTPEQYHKATGIEALFGYLYLLGQTERLRELFELVYCAAATVEA